MGEKSGEADEESGLAPAAGARPRQEIVPGQRWRRGRVSAGGRVTAISSRAALNPYLSSFLFIQNKKSLLFFFLKAKKYLIKIFRNFNGTKKSCKNKQKKDKLIIIN